MVAHPSLLKVPEDIQNLAKKSTPFLWNHATEDVMFNKEQQKIATEILKDTDNHREFRASPPTLPLPLAVRLSSLSTEPKLTTPPRTQTGRVRRTALRSAATRATRRRARWPTAPSRSRSSSSRPSSELFGAAVPISCAAHVDT